LDLDRETDYFLSEETETEEEYDSFEEWYFAQPSDDIEEEWSDGSNISCSDCPPSECTGHCMSCSYRPM